MHTHKQASTHFYWLLIGRFQDIVVEYSQNGKTSTNSTNSTDFGGVGYRGWVTGINITHTHAHKQTSTHFDWLLLSRFQDIVIKHSQIDITSTNSTNSTDFGGVGYRGRERKTENVDIWINDSSAPNTQNHVDCHNQIHIVYCTLQQHTQSHTHIRKYRTHQQ